MKITRRKLIEMIEEEVRVALLESADEDPGREQPQGGGPDPIASAPPIDGGMNDDKGQDLETAAVDGEGEDDAEAIDASGNAGENPSGAVNNEISGKTVQAITIEPRSKVLPGSREVIMTFNESTDALRILVTPTGQIKFFWRGQLHDIP
jgi:hypothetical protein